MNASLRTYITWFILSIFAAVPVSIKDLDGEYSVLKKQYPKLRVEWFLYMQSSCFNYRKYNIKPYEICAIIEHEGHWKPSIISAPNRDGSRDYGLCQINSKHDLDNPEKFLDPRVNIEKCIYEYSLCLNKSNGDRKTANRYYNAGRNNKPENYKNWKYVENINASRNVTTSMIKTYFIVK